MVKALLQIKEVFQHVKTGLHSSAMLLSQAFFIIGALGCREAV